MATSAVAGLAAQIEAAARTVGVTATEAEPGIDFAGAPT